MEKIRAVVRALGLPVLEHPTRMQGMLLIHALLKRFGVMPGLGPAFFVECLVVKTHDKIRKLMIISKSKQRLNTLFWVGCGGPGAPDAHA